MSERAANGVERARDLAGHAGDCGGGDSRAAGERFDRHFGPVGVQGDPERLAARDVGPARQIDGEQPSWCQFVQAATGWSGRAVDDQLGMGGHALSLSVAASYVKAGGRADDLDLGDASKDEPLARRLAAVLRAYYEMLGAEERAVLAALSIFPSGATKENDSMRPVLVATKASCSVSGSSAT